MQLTPILLPGESHRQRSLVDYSPWGCKELDTTEQLSMHMTGSASTLHLQTWHKRHGFDQWVGKIPWRRVCNPLQYFCLENPIDRGVWQSIGSPRVRHDESNLVCIHHHVKPTAIHHSCDYMHEITDKEFQPYLVHKYTYTHRLAFS